MIELLLLEDVRKLGHVGDVVKVRPGYARNYLLPQRLATAPTEENIKAIEDKKKAAAAERSRKMKEFQALAASLKDVSVTIEAAANPEGTLYGSVGPKEIAAALHALGHAVRAEHIIMDVPIRTLDNRNVKLEFTDEVTAQVKVWVVREGGASDAGSGDGDESKPTGGSDTGSKFEPDEAEQDGR
jgi:large subunit ribosomal protein L9